MREIASLSYAGHALTRPHQSARREWDASPYGHARQIDYRRAGDVGGMREDERARLRLLAEEGVDARRATRSRVSWRACATLAFAVSGTVACAKMGIVERVKAAMGDQMPVSVCNRASLEAVLGKDNAALGGQPSMELDFTYVNGFWYVPGKQHHSIRRSYEPGSLTTACLMGALGAKSVFVRDTQAECDKVVSTYQSGAEFDDTSVPGLDRMYGARDVDKVKCVVKPVAELPVKPIQCKKPYYLAWINKVPVLGEVSKMVHTGEGFEKLRSSNYFWFDADMAGPGDFGKQFQNFNSVQQMSKHLEAATTGISVACYHGSAAFSRPMGGGCDKVGDIVANFFGGSYDSVQYFDEKYREFVHDLAQRYMHGSRHARYKRDSKHARYKRGSKHAAALGNGFVSHAGCPREEWILARMAANEYSNTNSSERYIFSKQSCIYENPKIGPLIILHTKRCAREHSHMSSNE